MLAFVAEHMEKGFLENIIDMFKHDRGLWGVLPGLISDERLRVRLGAVALVEALRDDHREEIVNALPSIASHLAHPDRLVRGDAAYLLGVIGAQEAITYLEAVVEDPDLQVREIIVETIAEIKALRT